MPIISFRCVAAAMRRYARVCHASLIAADADKHFADIFHR
jgi:hypothetical protein